MDDLCTACLCTGRNLYFIGETGSYHLYSQILNEIPVYDFSEVCVRVCWECRALLRRFGEFKARVKRSYSELLQQLHQNIPPCKQLLARAPRLAACAAEAFGWPENSLEGELDQAVKLEVDDEEAYEVKEDIKPLKEEKPEDEHHSEPEPFVDDVELVPKRGRKRKATKKAEKKKKTKKVKSKKKLEEKKINSKKKAEEARSVSSEDSALFICEDSDAGIGDDEVKTETVTKKEEATEKETEVPRREQSEMASEEVTSTEYNHIEKRTQKNNGSLSPPKPTLEAKPTCAECGKVFSSKKTYRYHLNVLHKGQNRYPCPRCGKVYQWKSNLGRHMRTHKARDSGELYCETCDKRFASVATYRQHLRVSRRHVSESEFSFMCNECGKKFVNKTRLRDHVDWEHLNKIKFRCQLCDKNAAKLKYHIVAMHTSETPYQCPQCAAAFGWYSSLYRHVREVHYKMKLQPKKMRKPKRGGSPLPLPPHDLPPPLPPLHPLV
ncbi:hypothetical protein ABMA27_012182 [Loxostege sticticalis]|uniref:C2H2-type domain-containing protein n=1 Tax=Loxostege sticticalis TaxID=481309 RepID=A0ABR3H0E7_LOXSC